jgi:sensor histidine kinase YesM
MKKRHIILPFFLIWSFFSYAQQYTNYSTKNGLPSNHIYKITQDKKGFIWFITDKGMVKYNGKTFKTFTTKNGLPTNDIWNIRITNDNKVWFFTKANKLGYIENNKVVTFKSVQDEILYPVNISQNKNTISFSNSKKNYYLEDSLWKSKSIINDKYFFEKINHHNISRLKLSQKRDFLIIVDKNNKHLKAIKLYPTFLNYNYRGQVNDSLFCWLFKDKFEMLNLNTLKFYNRDLGLTQKKFIRFTNANDKIQFSDGRFVSFLGKNHQLLKPIKIPKHLNSHFSFIDKNKNIWVATFTNGVYVLPASKQQATYSLQNNKVGNLQDLNNKLIANVYNKGFYKFDTIKKVFIPFIPKNDFIYSANYIKELDTYYYVSDKEITSIKNDKKTIIYNDDIARKIIYHNNYLYTNTSYGINKINPKNHTIVKTFYQNGIKNIALFKEKIHLATANGLMVLENESVKKIKINNKDFNKPLTAIMPYNKNQLIICTDGFGAYITDFKKINLLKNSNFNDVANAFIKNNDIWLATNKGVYKYTKTKDSLQFIKKYTTNNGLMTNQINAVFIANNNIIASSNEGVSVIPVKATNNKQFMAIYFDDVLYNNQPFNTKKASYTKNNQLQLNIARIDYSQVNNTTYSYKLVPIQKKWTTTSSSQISFNDLPPNKYQLNIKSNNKREQLIFEIKPLWYQTILAKILFSLLFLSFLIGIYYLIRKRELAKHTKKLNAQKKLASFELHALRSQMNPHFVFNSLNAIQYFITKNEIDLSEKYLVKFAKLIRMFFDFSRVKEIYLKEEIKLLNAYLEIEKMRFGSDFNYKIDVINNLGVDTYKIPTMLLQPIVENAVNHGLFHNKGKGLIQIYFTFITKNSIEISIQDNGVGIEKVKNIQTNSLKTKLKKDTSTNVIKERIFLLNQTKKWTVIHKIFSNNKGTTVDLIFTKNE